MLNVSMKTIDRVKKSFTKESLEAVLNIKPRTRVFRNKVVGDLEAHLIAMNYSEPTVGHQHWSLMWLADKTV